MPKKMPSPSTLRNLPSTLIFHHFSVYAQSVLGRSVLDELSILGSRLCSVSTIYTQFSPSTLMRVRLRSDFAVYAHPKSMLSCMFFKKNINWVSIYAQFEKTIPVAIWWWFSFSLCVFSSFWGHACSQRLPLDSRANWMPVNLLRLVFPNPRGLVTKSLPESLRDPFQIITNPFTKPQQDPRIISAQSWRNSSSQNPRRKM